MKPVIVALRATGQLKDLFFFTCSDNSNDINVLVVFLMSCLKRLLLLWVSKKINKEFMTIIYGWCKADQPPKSIKVTKSVWQVWSIRPSWPEMMSWTHDHYVENRLYNGAQGCFKRVPLSEMPASASRKEDMQINSPTVPIQEHKYSVWCRRRCCGLQISHTSQMRGCGGCCSEPLCLSNSYEAIMCISKKRAPLHRPNPPNLWIKT